MGDNLGRFGRHEEMWAAQGRRGDEAAARFAVAARAARLVAARAPGSAHERALAEVAAGVAAPALAAFVLWVLRRAEELELKRLYFLSRDGQIMLKIARILAPALGSRCELRYLYGSRAAWCSPSLAGFDNDLLDWLLPPGLACSMRSALGRLHLAPERFEAELLSRGFAPGGWDRELSPAQASHLRGLLQEERFQQTLRAEAAQGHPLLLKYLRQEGLFDEAPWAMVDIGWHGTLQDSLGRLLAGAGGRAPHGFYCGASGLPDNSTGGVREAFFADARLSQNPHGQNLQNQDSCGENQDEILARIVTPLEAFCVANHGQVLGYAEEGGQVQPVLDGAVDPRLDSWGLPLVQHTICRFACELARDAPVNAAHPAHLAHPAHSLRPLAVEGIRRFWCSPRPAQARAWGELPCEDEGRQYFLARPYSARHLARALAAGGVGRSHFHSWHAGSLARTSLPVRLPLALLTSAAHGARRARRFFRGFR